MHGTPASGTIASTTAASATPTSGTAPSLASASSRSRPGDASLHPNSPAVTNHHRTLMPAPFARPSCPKEPAGRLLPRRPPPHVRRLVFFFKQKTAYEL